MATKRALQWLVVIIILAATAAGVGFGIWWAMKKSKKTEKYTKFSARTNPSGDGVTWVCAAGYKDTGRNWNDGKPNDWRHCVVNKNSKFTTNLRYDEKTNTWAVGECPRGYRPNGDQQGETRGGDRACVRNEDDWDMNELSDEVDNNNDDDDYITANDMDDEPW